MATGLAAQAARQYVPASAQAAQVLHDPNLIRGWVDVLKEVRRYARTGNLEPIVGTARMTTNGAGLLAANAQTRVFLDDLNDNQASGIVQTRADSNYFGGKVPQGEIFVLHGMEVQILADSQLNALDIEQIAKSVSVEIQLRETPVYSGAVIDWPSVMGARGQGNGDQTNGVRPFEPSVVIESLMSYWIVLTAVRAVQLSVAATVNIDFRVRNPATRLYDAVILGKS